ncbi:protein kinase [Glaciibacter sp. 2TAF33]|uniref:protein kinase n=1 Tax=Glaciibacter sp. 2TAF33 TaxID=3233015 RepID=UPI003F937B79
MSDPMAPYPPSLGRAAGTEAGTAAGTAAGPSMVAGYRVVRRLGTGSRSIVYLGHAGAGSSPDGAAAGGAVALKVFDPNSRDRSVEQTVAALSALTRAHAGRLPALLDLATLPDGRVVLVLERMGGGSLAELLRTRQWIEPGEAVTILAPVTAALGAVHAIGFAHRTLSQSSVLFDESGRPVLCGLGGLFELPPFGAAGGATASGGPDGEGTRLDGVRDDYARLTVLMRSVFDHLDPGSGVSRRAEPLAAWFEMAAATIPFQPALAELERRLFEWAPARPVRFTADPGAGDGDGAGAVAQRIGPLGRLRLSGAGAVPLGASSAAVADTGVRHPVELRETDGRAAAGTRRRRRGRERVRTKRRPGVLHLPPDVASVAATVLDRNPAAALGAWVRRRMGDRVRARRKPLVVAACLGSAVVVLALTLIPAAPPSDAPTQAPDGTRSQADASRAADARPGVRISAGERAAIAGDDPVLAALALLRVRAHCLVAASAICLDGADQEGSVALAADGYAVRMVQQGSPPAAAPAWDTYAASLAERTGDSALVILTPGQNDPQREPASLLVVKGEAGWRLREIFER